MGKVISLCNHKGGVGKTTSTLNIGAGLHKLGKKILMIDFDPQANLTQSLGIFDPQHTIYGNIREFYPLTSISILPGWDLIPSTLDLSGAEVELSSETGREYILREIIEPVKMQYDYIYIDSPPSLGLLTINALTASDELYIPLQPEFLALQGFFKLLQNVITKVHKRLNENLKVGGIFITQYDSRTVLHRSVIHTIENQFQDKIFDAKIRKNIALAEAPTKGLDIFRYDPKSNGAEDYLQLCHEIMAKE